MTVLEYLKLTYNSYDARFVREPIKCADGYTVSVQGGTDFHYCKPRKNCNEYECVELGFPSSLDEELADYAEEPNTTETVFAYVPLEVVEKVVAKHGGIVTEIPKKTINPRLLQECIITLDSLISDRLLIGDTIESILNNLLDVRQMQNAHPQHIINKLQEVCNIAYDLYRIFVSMVYALEHNDKKLY